MLEENPNVIPTPLSLIPKWSVRSVDLGEGGPLEEVPCLFSACMTFEHRAFKHIHMRQGIRTETTVGDGRKFLVLQETACSYHSSLARARKAKKQMCLTQRTRLRYILETLDHLFGSFGQIVIRDLHRHLNHGVSLSTN